MTADVSVTQLILDASLLVQAVMLLLLLASVSSWALIFFKRHSLKKAEQGAINFEEEFWAGGNLAEIYKRINEEGQGESSAGLERIFRAGFQEFSRMRKQSGAPPASVVEAAHRAMRVSVSREIDGAEQHLPFLATVGSVSPYVGLFGTVWGIMNSFRALAGQQQATLATVAPGIAEALIATALGLFAAIPAVVAYNHYSNRAERLANRYETFVEEFTSILERHTHAAATAAR
ncbi:protein TolQ [Halorhodospira halochloris]|uniref:Tol-Pal system protein TolQ n=1 Tax=Halorhodospira halochloris TaxID=1052 RepID=A0A0X8X788_HALHR|nr:protein TolQ [Halorhodospira halochloris]MBK1652286.1 protein TolQ [Halorhodospira halochloris]MCG5531594.1 protein TolQ [Halorhodospira halochloris]BAU56917.1 MotA/TolQ/ExbB proton channel family protein [Halorhodospira halochloris]